MKKVMTQKEKQIEDLLREVEKDNYDNLAHVGLKLTLDDCHQAWLKIVEKNRQKTLRG